MFLMTGISTTAVLYIYFRARLGLFVVECVDTLTMHAAQTITIHHTHSILSKVFVALSVYI